MTATLQNFVTIRKTRGDVLHPATFRTIVDMINGIIAKNDYSGLTADYNAFLAHIANHDDPHKVADLNWLPQIITEVYAIYVQMTAAPLSLADFQTQIVPTLGFLELSRRIVLNRYLYNQVKASDGSVPATASAYLSLDWDSLSIPAQPTALTFSPPPQGETGFRGLGWSGDVSPLPIVFSADNLTDDSVSLTTVFNTSSSAPYFSPNLSTSGYPFSIPLASNDFTVKFQTLQQPTVTTTVVSIMNDKDTIAVQVNPDTSITLLFNGTALNTTPKPCYDGIVTLVVAHDGSIVLQTSQDGVLMELSYTVAYTGVHPFSLGIIGPEIENEFVPTFSLRFLTVYRSYDPNLLVPNIIIPNGYVLLTDGDGKYLTDADGTPLMDYDWTVPDGYSLLMDPDRSFLTDADGTPLMDVDLTIPDGYALMADADGTLLTDPDGAYLIDYNITLPPGVSLLLDKDGSILTDTDGSFLMDFAVTIPAGYVLLTDGNGNYLTDTTGAFLMDLYSPPAS